MTADLQLVPGEDDTPNAPTAGATRHDAVLERAVLGALLQSPTVRDDVLASGLTGRDFYRPAHEAIWDAITAVADTGEPVDPKTVGAELASRGALSQVGGWAYLHTLYADVSSPWAAPHHAVRLVADARLRDLAAAGMRVVEVAATATREDVDEAIERATEAVAAVAETRHAGAEDDDLTDVIAATLDRFENGHAPGIATGLDLLDDILVGGLHPGSVTTIGARPGVGKTVVGLQIALNVARRGLGALYVSLEMSREDLLTRAYAAVGSIDYSRLLKAPGEPLSESEWRALARATEGIRESGLFIPARSHATVATIRSDIRKRMRRGGLAVAVIDYLQLVTPADSRVVREQQVAGIMRGLKLTALSTGVPIVLLAQLSREGDKAGRPPLLTDLRESGSVEQDSDNVVLLHRVDETTQPVQPGREDEGRRQPAPDEIGIHVAKNRRGPKSSLMGRFEGRYQRIRTEWQPGDASHRR